jgi:hypothetical protein
LLSVGLPLRQALLLLPNGWITDGMGWKGTARALRETFNHNDYLFNLAMLEREVLDYLFT